MTPCSILQRAYVRKYGGYMLSYMRQDYTLDEIMKVMVDDHGLSKDKFFRLLYVCASILELERPNRNADII